MTTPNATNEARTTNLLELAARDESAARCLRGYAKSYERLNRDIAGDFIRGAEALEERASRSKESANV